jgi:hypothetical protein
MPLQIDIDDPATQDAIAQAARVINRVVDAQMRMRPIPVVLVALARVTALLLASAPLHLRDEVNRAFDHGFAVERQLQALAVDRIRVDPKVNSN